MSGCIYCLYSKIEVPHKDSRYSKLLFSLRTSNPPTLGMLTALSESACLFFQHIIIIVYFIIVPFYNTRSIVYINSCMILNSLSASLTLFRSAYVALTLSVHISISLKLSLHFSISIYCTFSLYVLLFLRTALASSTHMACSKLVKYSPCTLHNVQCTLYIHRKTLPV